MIVCCGEALIDFVPRPVGAGRTAYVPALGGSSYNTAIAVGRLGARVGFLGGISGDFFGQQLVAGLEQSKVSTAYVSRLDRPTTLAFVNLGQDEPQYAFYDENAAERMWLRALAPVLGDDVTALHFGSISLVREPSGSEFEALMMAQKGHRLLSFDPNIRPGLVADEAAYRARLSAMIGVADIIRASRADIAWLAPNMSADEFAKTCLTNGACLFVLTQGDDAAVAFRRDPHGGPARVMTTPIVPVAVADTVGAGDAFMGGLLARLQQCDLLSPPALMAAADELVGTALDQAARVAAVACTRVGADPPWHHQL